MPLFQRQYAFVTYLAGCFLMFSGVPSWAEQPLEPRPSLLDAVGPMVQNYCLDCHTGEDAEAGFSFDPLFEVPEVNRHRKAWKKVLAQLRNSEMPPEEAEQPTKDEREDVTTWIDEELNNLDCSGPQNPGHVTIRRLNRTEYRNTIRDLVGVDFDPGGTFPRDTLGYGFDNNSDAQSLSPLMIEKYLNAAEQIAAAAIVIPESLTEPKKTFLAPQLHGGDHNEKSVRKLFSNGRVWAKVHFETSGEYLLRGCVYASQSGDELARMVMDGDNRELKSVDVDASGNDPQTFVARFHADAGESEVGVSFINDHWNPNNPDRSRRDRNLYIRWLEVVGPSDALRQDQLPESHQLVLPSSPSETSWQHKNDWRRLARQLVRQFLSRAFRRPAAQHEIDRGMQLVNRAHEVGDSFERAMQLVVEMTLVSPSFLFRGELTDKHDNQFETDIEAHSEQDNVRSYPLDDYQLATRLSYFLWSSMPDQELSREAAAGTLQVNLGQQLDRMLASPRADELIRNFGEQWLEIRRLEIHEPDAQLFPEFDDALRWAMRKETLLLLQSIFRQDLPLATLINADYSYLNDRLAEHYEIEPGEYEASAKSGDTGGDPFQRVNLPAARHAGLLTHGSVLSVTSHADRTSPVQRGKWILEHLLNDAPPPPPVVSDLPNDSQSIAGKSLRERLEIHRADPACNVCHKVMDPMGFALENFDPLGRWRDSDGSFPIDAHGRLPDGRDFSGPTGLRDLLLEDFDVFRKCLVEQLLTYALGRGLEYYDQCAINQIADEVSNHDDTFSGIIRAIVHSDPFQMQLAEEDDL